MLVWMDTIMVDLNALLNCVDNPLVASGALILKPHRKSNNDDVSYRDMKMIIWSFYFILYSFYKLPSKL